MTLATPAQTTTWTYVDGNWYEGNVALVGPRSHVMWLGSSVFDGARWFEGVAPDLGLHAKRLNSSAIALGLKPTIAAEEIVSRLLGAMATEGDKLLAAKIAQRAGDIDLVMINGYGFPAHKGGPMFAAGKT